MPMHNFIIENKSEINESIYTSYSWDTHGHIHKSGLMVEEHVGLEDEFLSYIQDSLNWLNTWNPSTCKKCSGLNNYGITVIEEKDTLLKFHQLIRAWIDVFNLAPDQIKLTGDYCFDGNEQRGYYEKLMYNRVELINELNKLANMAKDAEVNGKCIVHFGI
ncbi:hypothetical protein QP794_03470 [Paenibacillus sp. UMB7766-LJ446]|uniref:hypothetical protein n=1 Tax=unclassified Paenibacillus TaxID=185978 RepID=UPI00046671F8|nr:MULTISPECIES: hypothetical protein [unclassified Paenibacillus]KGP85507.1 hypothetical protein P364_0100370 [Paenibacillus sp. MAEPY2]KGP87274.1 hypothetical protein P363_0113330 [Paenibacillus sp. MAEPY1]MDK8189141.1 hypothetical protein [Paenibacillus sp. UMB7766-LJ446]